MKRFAGIHIGISLAFLTVFGFLLVAPAALRRRTADRTRRDGSGREQE